MFCLVAFDFCVCVCVGLLVYLLFLPDFLGVCARLWLCGWCVGCCLCFNIFVYVCLVFVLWLPELFPTTIETAGGPIS